MNKIFRDIEITIKRKIVVETILPLKNKIKSVLNNNNNKFEYLKKDKKIILMQTPTHKNLGDHAIAYAERKFAEDNFKDYKIIEIPFKEVMSNSYDIKKVMMPNDIIFIIGGGNMTDMYIEEEYMRRFIIKTFKRFKIISFPQTISFSDTTLGKFEIRKSIKTYGKHKNLTIVAREYKSYNLMKKIYNKNNILVTPDIVLYLNKCNEFNREGCTILLREDKERVRTKEFDEIIMKSVKASFNKVLIDDTVVEKDVSLDKREYKLNEIWKKISKSEIVITDRLHGMIFCAITATPCIVLRNSNHKIEESYNAWLKDLGYIKLIDESLSIELDEIIKELRDRKSTRKHFNMHKDKFCVLENAIKN